MKVELALSYTLCHSCLKVHVGVPVVLYIISYDDKLTDLFSETSTIIIIIFFFNEELLRLTCLTGFGVLEITCDSLTKVILRGVVS